MPKATLETAKKMLQLVVTTYQGKLTYLMIGFLYQTRAGFSEIVSLTIGDVYRDGRAKKAVPIGEGPRQRTQILDDQARKIVDDLVGLQVQRGHRSSADAPLFRSPAAKRSRPSSWPASSGSTRKRRRKRPRSSQQWRQLVLTFHRVPNQSQVFHAF